MFKRKAYAELKEWKKWNGEYAVLLEGAKRVGKSTIAREFAQNEYKSFILIDFSTIDQELLSIFQDINNLNVFFTRLQLATGIELHERQSVIIFDEVQLYPKARQAIKHLVADGRYDYIETGSLISIKKNVDNILIPSEEHKIEVHPMDFEEFCDAVGFSRQNLQMLYNLKAPIGESVNRKLIRDFRLYMAIGGMPQAVDAFVSKKSFGEIDKIKQEIIGLYKDDLRKIDKSGRLSEMYESIPAQLTAERNRFTYGYGLKRKYKKDEERLFDLLDSKIVDCCRSVFDISPSLAQYTDYSKFKLYVADTGLFVSMLFNSGSKEHEDLYKKLLSDKLELNLGYLYENVAAQIITSAKRKLYYFNFPKENSTHSYEIDFLLNDGNKILPLEIKSSKINVHKSIDEFSRKYSKYISHSYIISSKDYFKDGNLINLPFYLLPFLLNDL